tara:strand:- start:9367 stop:10518 length:1152 start_codon:yes stop_codon:yes gene_type:complete
VPCINTDNLLYVKTYSLHDKEVIKIDRNIGYYAKENVDYDFFYIQFSNADSFSMFSIDDIVSKDILDRVKDKKVFLVLDNGLEHFYECADAIYRDIVIKYNIPAEQIIFLSAVPTMNTHVAQLAKKLKLPEIKVDWFSLFEATGKDAAKKGTVALPKKKNYNKKFLLLNRRWRLHRPLLITLLRSRNLLDQGYISFAPSDDGHNWNTVYPRLQAMYNNHNRISKILSDNADVKNLKPMYLDTEDLVTNRAMHEDSISKYYVETYFSIVSETTYHEGTPFLSEKIFKAIAMGHPFIIVTAPNSLQYLKALGYKTYSPFIDESYDSIQDDGDRMLAILDQIEKLCSMPKKTLRKQWLPNVRTIANHNRNLLLKNYSKDLCVPMNY